MVAYPAKNQSQLNNFYFAPTLLEQLIGAGHETVAPKIQEPQIWQLGKTNWNAIPNGVKAEINVHEAADVHKPLRE